MKVLVTGANGFLGSHIIRLLNEQDYEVRAFILKGTSEDNLKGLKYELFTGNLLDAEDIDQALSSCDYLIHTAAITDIWPTKNTLSWKINYDVVKQLAISVSKSSIKKYIHIGTANSFGYGSKEEPGNETMAYNCGKFGFDYIDSKKAAQDYLLSEANKEKRLPVVIINPTFMIGTNDSKPGPGEMIMSVMSGKLPVYSAGGRCFAAVEDVAKACVNAIEKGQVGECYITGGSNLSYKEFFSLIGKVAQVKAPKIKIPTFLAIAFASILEFFARIFKKKPALSIAMARISGKGNYYSSAKAIRDLDYPQSDLENALKEAIEWYKDNGYFSE